MKKTFITMTAALMAAAAVSCSTGENNAKTSLITKGSLNKMDSLSYVMGVTLSHQQNGGIVKELELDTKTINEAMEKAAFGEDVIVGKDTVNEANMRRIYNKVLGRQRQAEIQAAKSDSTGNTKLYESEELRQLTSAFVGADCGMSLNRFNLPLQMAWIKKGIEDCGNGKTSMTIDDCNSYIQNYMMVKVPAQNAEASAKWLAKVEKEKGVKKTASGLLYKIDNQGDMNAKPNSVEDVVKVHYKGTTRTGKEFDSSYKRNSPIDFPLNGVIKGWGEGLQLVGKGGKITLWIPAELAYGSRGAGADIGPNEALRFDVELLDVTHKEK